MIRIVFLLNLHSINGPVDLYNTQLLQEYTCVKSLILSCRYVLSPVRGISRHLYNILQNC